MSDPVLMEVRGNIAALTLNRPQKLNALSYALIDRLMRLLDLIEDDAALRAVILTGAGDKAFSAGADIREFSESVRQGPDVALRAFVRRGQGLTARLEAFPSRSLPPSTGLPMAAAARSPRPCIWRSPAIPRCSPSPRSTSAFPRRLAARSGCRGWPGASARWKIR